MTLEEAIEQLEEMNSQFVHSKPGPFAEILEAICEVRDERQALANFKLHEVVELQERIAALEAERDGADFSQVVELRQRIAELEAELHKLAERLGLDEYTPEAVADAAMAMIREVCDLRDTAYQRIAELEASLRECYDWMANNGGPGRLLRQADAALAGEEKP